MIGGLQRCVQKLLALLIALTQGKLSYPNDFQQHLVSQYSEFSDIDCLCKNLHLNPFIYVYKEYLQKKHLKND